MQQNVFDPQALAGATAPGTPQLLALVQQLSPLLQRLGLRFQQLNSSVQQLGSLPQLLSILQQLGPLVQQLAGPAPQTAAAAAQTGVVAVQQTGPTARQLVPMAPQLNVMGLPNGAVMVQRVGPGFQQLVPIPMTPVSELQPVGPEKKPPPPSDGTAVVPSDLPASVMQPLDGVMVPVVTAPDGQPTVVKMAADPTSSVVATQLNSPNQLQFAAADTSNVTTLKAAGSLMQVDTSLVKAVFADLALSQPVASAVLQTDPTLGDPLVPGDYEYELLCLLVNQLGFLLQQLRALTSRRQLAPLARLLTSMIAVLLVLDATLQDVSAFA
jgi:hypothetical protein